MSSRARGASYGKRRTRAPGRPAARPASKRWPMGWLLAGGAVLVAAAIGGAILLARGGGGAGGGDGLALSRITTPDFHSMAISPGDPAFLVYGSHGGVMRSTDGGRSWNKTNLTGQADDAMGMGYLSTDGLKVVAAGHDTYFQSEDGGATWTKATPKLPGTDIHGLATVPGQPGTIYANVVRFGIYRSGDGGATWTKVTTGEFPGDVMTIAASRDGRLYAASMSGGVLRSDDGGGTFRKMGNVVGAMSIASAASDPNVVFVGTQSGLFYSADGGQVWQTRSLPSGGAVMVTAVSSTNPLDVSIVVVDNQGTGRVYRSADGGESWRSAQGGQ